MWSASVAEEVCRCSHNVVGCCDEVMLCRCCCCFFVRRCRFWEELEFAHHWFAEDVVRWREIEDRERIRLRLQVCNTWVAVEEKDRWWRRILSSCCLLSSTNWLTMTCSLAKVTFALRLGAVLCIVTLLATAEADGIRGCKSTTGTSATVWFLCPKKIILLNLDLDNLGKCNRARSSRSMIGLIVCIVVSHATENVFQIRCLWSVRIKARPNNVLVLKGLQG